MVSISTLRTFINNGWTIANRRNVISKIGKNTFNEISELAAKIGRTGDKVRYCDFKSFLQANTISETREALTSTNVAYHGSPFLFDFFDIAKIGNGEGMNKYCKGLYLARTKRIAPFYANIRSEISRAIRWKSKGNAERMEACVERALELIDLTIVSCQLNIDKSKGRLREVLRCRDEICDYFYGYNEYEVDEILMQRYFDEFAYVV